MSEHDRLTRALEVLEPPFEAEPEAWADVLRRAQPPPRFPRRRPRALAVALATIAAACAVVLADPFGGGDRDGVLDLALAAVGKGPVLRVVTETQIGGTLVELGSGRRTKIRARKEVLFDPKRGMRTTVRLGRTVLEDYGTPAGRRLGYAGEALQAFTRDYREALRSGRADVLSEEEIDGTPVYWIRVPLGPKDSKARTPCRPYRFCQDVAISRETYEPLYLSVTPPGAKPRVLDRILKVESLPAGTGEIPGRNRSPGVGFSTLPRRYDIDRSRADRMLGRAVAWPGRRLAGLRLSRIDAVGLRTYVFTRKMRRPRYGPRERVIRLVFSTRGQIESGRPAKSWKPLLIVNQARYPTLALNYGPGMERVGDQAGIFTAPYGYAPPPSTMLVTGNGHQAILRHRGLFLSVLATRKDDVPAAVRALRRVRSARCRIACTSRNPTRPTS